MSNLPTLPDEPALEDKTRFLEQRLRATTRLVGVVQSLSLARDLAAVMEVVRKAARELTGAEGATFVLRDRDQCYYAEEDAIAPLWKGQRFPLTACISGWTMLHRQPAVIPDIYADPRIPADAYRPTFVKSLVMVPIRTEAPVGAIGNYWAQPHAATSTEVELLQALANTTAVAMENVQLYGELEQRVQARTRELETLNRELEAFSYSVSHDLRAPLRGIDGWSQALVEDYGDRLDPQAQQYLHRVRSETQRMGQLIDDLLELSRLTRQELRPVGLDLSTIAYAIVARLREAEPGRQVELRIAPGLTAFGDPRLLEVALTNLLSNAWKYTGKRPVAQIEFGLGNGPAYGDRNAESSACGAQSTECGTPLASSPDPRHSSPPFFVRDNGAGFDMAHAQKLFAPFQRLHRASEFPGTGVGLATVQRIIHRHGGQVWAEAKSGHGATFYFTLPVAPLAHP